MSREDFDHINNAFLGHTFDGQLPQSPEYFADANQYESLVKAAYVARGELSPTQIEDDGLDLDEAMHEGVARVNHWVGRLENGDLDPAQLLAQMLEEALEGNQGLNKDESHVQFREAFAKEFLEAMQSDPERDAEELLEPRRLEAVRDSVGTAVSEDFRYRLEDLDDADSEPLPRWFRIEIDKGTDPDALMEEGELRAELREESGFMGFDIDQEVLDSLPDTARDQVKERRIPEDRLVPEQANFHIEAFEDVTVEEGEPVMASGTIENLGEVAGEQDVELEIASGDLGEVITLTEAAFKLEAGASDEFEINTFEKEFPAGAYDLTLSTEDDTATRTLTVEPDLDPALFEVSDLDLSADAAEEGTTVTVTALVANAGDESATQDVVLEIDGSAEGEDPLKLDGGAEETVSFDLDTGDLAEGAYEVRIASDDASDEQVLTVEPDLDPALFEVSDLDLSAGAAEEGTMVMVTALVANVGDESATQGVALEVDGEAEAEERVTLDGGASEYVSYPLDTGVLGEGRYDVRIVSDNDATGTQSLTVEPHPDLEPDPGHFEASDLDLSADAVEEGTTVTVAALVANTGDESATHDVVLEVDGEAEAEERVTLDGGASENVRLPLDTGALGEGGYDVRIVSDDDATGTQSLTVNEPEGYAELQISGIELDPEEVKIGETFDLKVTYELTGEESGEPVEISLAIQEADLEEGVNLTSHSDGAFVEAFEGLKIDDPGVYDAVVTIDAPNASQTSSAETIEIINTDSLPPSLSVDSVEVNESHMLAPNETFSVEVGVSETAGVATENLYVQLDIHGAGIAESKPLGALEGDNVTVDFSDLHIGTADGFKATVTLHADNADGPVSVEQPFTVSDHPHDEIDYPDELEMLWREDASVSPFDAIGQVVVDQGDWVFGGTGFMITPQHFMTSAHVVDLNGSVNISESGDDIAGLSGDIDSIGLLLSQNGGWPVGGTGDPFPDDQIFGERVWSLGGGSESGAEADYSDDLAIVELEEPVAGVDPFKWFWNEPGGSRDLSGHELSWAGYPTEGFEQNQDSDAPPEFYMWQAFGQIADYDHDGGHLNATPEMEGRGGASGSPLFTDIDGSPHFVGAYAGRITDRSDELGDIGAGATLTPEAHDWALDIVQSEGYLVDQDFAA